MIMQTMKTAGAGLLVMLLASCAGTRQPGFPLPDEPGLYAVDSNDDLHRLDGDREWEIKSWPDRAAMGAYTEFVIFDPDLKRDARPRENLVSLWRVAWVRSEVDSRGLAGPVQGSEWAVAPLEPFRVPVSVRSAEGYAAYVHVRPHLPLEPGLYSLRLAKAGTSRAGRLGVEWAEVDKRHYSAVNCVDRYLDAEPSYRSCIGRSAAGAAAAGDATAGGTALGEGTVERKTLGDSAMGTPGIGTSGGIMSSGAPHGLEVTLVEPLRRGDDLIVQGVVINTSAERQPVPDLEAVLIDESGRPLTRAMIESRQVELQPGERMRFKTEVIGAPQTTARVDVSFAPMTNAAK